MGSAFGQTPAKLIEKYKAMPGAAYENTTKESLEGLETEDSILSAEDRAKLKKHFKKSEQVQFQNIDEEMLAQINQDIKAMKNHELLFETIRNAGSESLEDSANLIRKVVADILNPTIKMQCYGKVDGKMVSDLLLRVEIWNTVALSHIDTKIDRDIWMKAMEKSNFYASDNEKAEKAESKEAVKAVEKLTDGIGNIVDIVRALFRAGREPGKRIKRNQVYGNVLKHVGGADKSGRLFHRHPPVVDILRPDIAELLLAFQIIFRHMFHGDGCVFEVLYLPPERIPVLKPGVENNEDQYGSHNDHVDVYNESFFHALISGKRVKS